VLGGGHDGLSSAESDQGVADMAAILHHAPWPTTGQRPKGRAITAVTGRFAELRGRFITERAIQGLLDPAG
jgi:hypothetical protein